MHHRRDGGDGAGEIHASEACGPGPGPGPGPGSPGEDAPAPAETARRGEYDEEEDEDLIEIDLDELESRDEGGDNDDYNYSSHLGVWTADGGNCEETIEIDLKEDGEVQDKEAAPPPPPPPTKSQPDWHVSGRAEMAETGTADVDRNADGDGASAEERNETSSPPPPPPAATSSTDGVRRCRYRGEEEVTDDDDDNIEIVAVIRPRPPAGAGSIPAGRAAQEQAPAPVAVEADGATETETETTAIHAKGVAAVNTGAVVCGGVATPPGASTSSAGSSGSSPSSGLPSRPVTEFITHLFRMLTDASIRNLIEWTPQGFIRVHDPVTLENEVLGRYFRHSKYASFQRQLNYFGFRKIKVVGFQGRMSPCSFVNDGVGKDLSNLFGIKRRNANQARSRQAQDRKEAEAKAKAQAATSAATGVGIKATPQPATAIPKVATQLDAWPAAIVTAARDADSWLPRAIRQCTEEEERPPPQSGTSADIWRERVEAARAAASGYRPVEGNRRAATARAGDEAKMNKKRTSNGKEGTNISDSAERRKGEEKKRKKNKPHRVALGTKFRKSAPATSAAAKSAPHQVVGSKIPAPVEARDGSPPHVVTRDGSSGGGGIRPAATGGGAAALTTTKTPAPPQLLRNSSERKRDKRSIAAETAAASFAMAVPPPLCPLGEASGDDFDELGKWCMAEALKAAARAAAGYVCVPPEIQSQRQPEERRALMTASEAAAAAAAAAPRKAVGYVHSDELMVQGTTASSSATEMVPVPLPRDE